MTGVAVRLHRCSGRELVADDPHAHREIDLQQLEQPGLAEVDEGQIPLPSVDGGRCGVGDAHGVLLVPVGLIADLT